MTPQTAVIKLRLRLNKIHSSDYDNIPDYAAVEAINKAALERCRRTIAGSVGNPDVAEETTRRVEDLQFLLKPKVLKGRNNRQYFNSDALPSDYLWWSRLIPYGNKGSCTDVQFKTYFVEEANILQLLTDWSWAPDFDWRQTLYTLAGNRVRVYTGGDFNIDYIDLLYYRKPIEMDIEGYTHPDGRTSTNVNLEFKDDLAELILDEAAAILAGDIESINQLQINKERATNNN